uniref:NADH-ubiquinone oxidoreductase chain 1 n=1 Tax=Bovicola caprae TaxID=1647116 RepID=A0A3P8MXI1_9NEOP|nr:NADH dehydrogenase subunit 1 [Bovicola caprae]
MTYLKLESLILAAIQILDVFVCVLMSVAFYTLFERKILGLIQVRLGPNKVGMSGILQPFSDAMKLLSKTQSSPVKSGLWGFLLAPTLSFLLSISIWMVFSSFCGTFSLNLCLFVVFMYLSLSAYPLIFAGWFSNSKYSSIGGIRSVALSLSYEIPLSFSILGVVLMWKSPNPFYWGGSLMSGLVLSQIGMILTIMICFLVETGRSPFDLAEGESELVSGYCVEYGGGLYILVFLSEYLAMFFSGLVISSMFLHSPFTIVAVVFASAWLRGTLPRIRFDLLMSTGWLVLIPLSMGLFFSNCILQ